MGFLKGLVLGFSFGIFAYYAYNPLPPNIEQPVLYSIVTTLFRIIDDLGKVSESLGWKEVLIFRRDALSFIVDLLARPIESDIKVTDTEFGGVPVRVFQPAGKQSRDLTAGFIYVHGGGFTLGSVRLGNAQMVQIVRDTQVTVVSIEYRLAPEHPTPAALEDCEAATRHFFSNAEEWGVDSRRIGIGGDSAGGNMAAVLSLKLRDMGGNPQFSYQVLIYPWTQAIDFNLPSYSENEAYNRPDMKQYGMALFTLGYLDIDRANAEKLTRNQHVSKAMQDKYKDLLNIEKLGYEKSRRSWNQKYEVDKNLASQMESHITNPYNFPLMAKSVGGLPPALVITMGLDPLRDEGLLYLDRLRKAGVETQHYNDDICWHGSLNFSHGLFKFKCGFRLLMSIIDYINETNDL